ncbi:MAG: hypothetical protein GKR90_16020 [Pseudomonadales bacterium]|nr:hypothetical protein [Pseudomonadales bacterium]
MPKSNSDVHLVGSVPLASATEVFRRSAERLDQHICRYPDGETGDRTNWIGWQLPKLAASKGLVSVAAEDHDYGTTGLVGLAGSDAEVEITNLGYRDAALASYAEFTELKSQGVVAAGSRFQVCLPTPLAPVHLYVQPKDRVVLEEIYEAALLREVGELIGAIPDNELAIQWDTAIEFGVLEGVFPTYLTDPSRQITERLVRLGEAIPAKVELGYHLCYGDAGHQHFVEPNDMSKLVAIANAVSAALTRSIDWIHMPVPRNRSDDSYFQPLSELTLDTATKLYLGLIHASDGEAGGIARIEAAKKFCADFGIATECGLGRRPAESIPELLELHQKLAQRL